MNGRTKVWWSHLAQKHSHPTHRNQIRLRTQARNLIGTEQACGNFPGKGPGSEERVETKGLGQPPNLAEVEDDRSSGGIYAKVAGVHVGLGEDQGLMGNTYVGDSWGPPAEVRNGLTSKEKGKLCVSGGNFGRSDADRPY